MANNVGSIIGSAQRAQLLSMQKTARQLDVTSLRLATGQKVSSALDNADSFFLARSLRNKAADLSRLLDGIGQNIRVIEEADHGIKADLKILDLAESYLKDIEEKYQNGEIGTITGIPANETHITFLPNGVGVTQYIAGQDQPATGPMTTTSSSLTLAGSLWKRKLVNYDITPNTVLIFDYRSTRQPEISAIGFDDDTDYTNDDNRFFLYGTQVGGVTTVEPTPIYLYPGGSVNYHYEIPVGTYFTGTFSHMTFINDDDAPPRGNATFRNIILREGPQQAAPITNDTAAFDAGYAQIIDQLDQIARDAHYRGVNLLKGDDMTTVFNEDRSSTLVSKGIMATVAGLGLEKSKLDSLESVQAKLSQIRAARAVLRAYGSTLTTNMNVIQIRHDFVKDQINTRQAGADKLTLADLNEEGVNILALQTAQQLQTAMMAMRPNTVLDMLA